MRNVFRVFAQDIQQLAHAPAAWIVLFFLALLPSFYTWFNVEAFWNPYENTASMRVCFVNEDAGADDSTLGHFDLGAQIEDELRENNQLSWVFETRTQAMDDVASGKAYAAIIVPSTFSQSIVDTVHGNQDRPILEYYVNEKVGPVAPKITDAGATMLDTKINDAFVSAVSEAVATTFNKETSELRTKADESKQSVISDMSDATRILQTIQETLGSLPNQMRQAASNSRDAATTMRDIKPRIDDLSHDLAHLSELLGNASSKLLDYSASLGSALDDASAALTQASSTASTSITETAASLQTAIGTTQAALERTRAIAQENEQIISLLTQTAQALPEGEQKQALQQVIDTLETSNQAALQTIDNLESMTQDLSTAINDIATQAANLNELTQHAIQQADSYRETLRNTVIPQLSASLGNLATATGQLGVAIGSTKTLIDQSISLLSQLADTLDTASNAFDQTTQLVANAERDLDTIMTDLAALDTSRSIGSLFKDGTLDSSRIADFMLAPTHLTTEKLYPLDAYGSAMAPLFINLTLWVGAFMLMVIIRKEVDGTAIDNLTINQRFFGRGILLSIMAALQAIVCCTGCLLLGVQTASAPMFYLTAVLTSLAYLCIQYTLSTTLQHVGMGACIILVFIQIPGATGLYPIEMTPDFFRTVYPLFPFTYGINAIRETIGGFYPGAWGNNMAILLAFGILFLILGSLARPYLTNLNRLFSRQVHENDLIHGEVVEAPERHFRTSQILRALSDQAEFKAKLEASYAVFMRRYPLLKHVGLAVGIAIPVIATIVLSLLGVEKVIILTVWLLSFAIVAGYLIALEYACDSLERQAQLNAMSEEDVRALYASQNALLKHSPQPNKGGDA